MRAGPCPHSQVAASWLGAGRLAAAASGPSLEPGTLAWTASPPATSACHFGRRALTWGYGGLTSLFSSFARQRGCDCCWTVVGRSGLQGEGAFTPGAGSRRGRFRSPLEAGDRSSEKRELLAPSLGHTGAPAVTSAGLPWPCPPLPHGHPSNLLSKTAQRRHACARRPAARNSHGNPGNFFFLALPRTAPTATSSSPFCPAARSKVGPGLQLAGASAEPALVKPLWLLRPLREGCGPHTKTARKECERRGPATRPRSGYRNPGADTRPWDSVPYTLSRP